MILTLTNVIDAKGRAALDADLAQLRWVDGTQTAGWTASQVKQNQQADLSSRAGVRIRDRLQNAIQSNAVFTAAAQPARLSKLILSRMSVGDGYGLHIDNPFMDFGDKRLRTDLSFTLFLSAPEDYEGGELVIDRPDGSHAFKPAAGSLVLYPSTFLHQVNPVIRGERLVCVGWVDSLIRDAGQREIVFDLENLAASVAASFGAQSTESLTLAKAIANLKRSFS